MIIDFFPNFAISFYLEQIMSTNNKKTDCIIVNIVNEIMPRIQNSKKSNFKFK